MKKTIFAAMCVLLYASQAFAMQNGYYKTMKINGGNTVSIQGGAMDNKVYYNRQLIYHDQENYDLVFVNGESDDNQSVLLMQVTSGGTACPAQYVVMTCTGSKVIMTKPFGTCSDKPVFFLDKGKPVVTLQSMTKRNQVIWYRIDGMNVRTEKR